ncbi:S-layer homology domain-containing protein [Arthrobacter sp. zg-Y1219]|uniref:CAP and S-layer homology domain-containing protein n=1 Tax=Arthrobacter sp. zg-Y1219 TaxID=3049067 RepID=UPI0024C2B9E4|nr:CAP domain-containing protein [Arthrobacter sp. zg-Y1219]MDK1359166.1 S-layer homology domain-containing protein [Arthrobacter sp. zg-Y1219]
MKKNTACRTVAVRATCVLILASLSIPGAAAAADPRAGIPAVSTVEEIPETPPVMPDTPRPDPAALSPEAAEAAVKAAAEDAALGTGSVVLPEGMEPGAATAPDASAPDATVDSVRSDKFAGQVFDLMNAKRRASGVPALTWNQGIADVSQGWANHLRVATADPNFDWAGIHRADAGSSLIPKGANWYGEIIAFNFSAGQVVDWWMNSPAHRAAMLDSRETHAGIGYVVPTSGPYKGWHLVVSNLAGYPKTAKPAVVSPFADLVGGQQFLADMNWMYNKGISTGWAEGNGTRTYRPLQSISREAMAAFMYRLKGSPAYTPPKKSPFVDVSTSNPYYKEISWLAAKKISTGWKQKNGVVFRPHDPVSRDAMAAFLYRLAGSPKYTAPKKSPFVDVATSNQFYTQISWLAASGVSTGWGMGNGKAEYRPGGKVARDAMAAFMKRWAA